MKIYYGKNKQLQLLAPQKISLFFKILALWKNYIKGHKHELNGIEHMAQEDAYGHRKG